MPELPEVETIVKYLNNRYLNKIIVDISCPNQYSKVLENGTLNDYKYYLINKRIIKISRMGKYIIFKLDNGNLIFHLRMTGNLLPKLKFKDQWKLIPPQTYLNFLSLMYFSKGVFTDSGGIQEESTYLNIPCFLKLTNLLDWLLALKSYLLLLFLHLNY